MTGSSGAHPSHADLEPDPRSERIIGRLSRELAAMTRPARRRLPAVDRAQAPETTG